ncbi:hypothetical protein ACHAO4_010305 [Trichoderma viride]
MADHHMPAPRSAGFFSASHRDGRRDGLATPERRRNSSHEMGKSSVATSQREDDDGLLHDDLLHDDRDHDHDPLSSSHTEVSSHADDAHAHTHAHREERAQKKHKGRLGGGFLLHDAFGGARLLGSRRQRAAHVPTPAPPIPQLQLGGRDASFEAGPGPERSMRQSSAPIRPSGEPANSPPNTGHSAEGRMLADSHHQEPHPVADLDSSQIVHMALSLSESRRLASRRTGHRTAAPPRLAPLPDASSSNNIRQHLQQQRKLSRTETPSLLQEPSSGPLVPGSRGSGNFQSSFEGAHDSQYRYQFTASTLARAHKAKVHLELWAQYRRLLDVLPPLKPGLERPTSGGSPDSPFGAGSQALAVTLGRQYNPLQYIRNRKVRARERKVIDGKRQGFSDVDSVRQWVDTVYRQKSIVGTPLADDGPSIPPYHSAEEADMLLSPADTAARPRRPRVDWFLDPCDVIADAYWLEQNGHKYLIEDRHWRKIFPPISSDFIRPLSREVEESSSKISPFTTRDYEATETIPEVKEFGLSKVRSELSHTSAKNRAKQKFQNIKGFHHRHASGGGGHHGKDSSSEDSSSDSDSESKKRAKLVRKGTISSNSNDLLQKQMMEMVAREARERELEESALVHNESADDRSIEQPSSQIHSRRGSSVAEISDSERRAAMFDRLKQGSPSRPSVDAHHHSISPGKRLSLPNSPEAVPIRNGKSESVASVDTSPLYSRSTSPTRNPINKIKQLMRDKNGEARGGPLLDDPYDDGEGRLSKRETNLARSGSTSTLGKGRRQSSPAGKLPSGSDSSKNLRPIASARLRTDEGVGLRGMFKGPRIDNVLRGGVSKLGDMIRKKDASGETPDLDTTDESDSDRVRGRRSEPMILSRKPSTKIQEGQPKHFLDTMPEFRHMPSYRSFANGGDKLTKADGLANSGRRPGELDLPRPPQISIRSASSSASPPVSRKLRLGGDSDVSDPESLLNNSIPDGVRDADKRLNSAISLSDKDNQHGRSLSQHWSIADRGMHGGPAKLTKREVARMRALILSSGVMAMEMHRRAYEQHRPFSKENLALNEATSQQEPGGVPWTDITRLTPHQVQVRLQLHEQKGPFCEMYPLAAQTLGVAIQSWGQRWQSSADYFRDKTVHTLRTRVWEVRTHIADDLSEMARKAADEADEISRDMALGQPLKIKHVVDTMETMLQTRRRRFRWLRRGLWLTVEWLLVGFMWYVWFMVMILRVFLGVGKGVLRGVKWLLWL